MLAICERVRATELRELVTVRPRERILELVGVGVAASSFVPPTSASSPLAVSYNYQIMPLPSSIYFFRFHDSTSTETSYLYDRVYGCNEERKM